MASDDAPLSIRHYEDWNLFAKRPLLTPKAKPKSSAAARRSKSYSLPPALERYHFDRAVTYAIREENFELTARVSKLERLVESLTDDIYNLHRRALTHEVVFTTILDRLVQKGAFTCSEIVTVVDEAEVFSRDEASR